MAGTQGRNQATWEAAELFYPGQFHDGIGHLPPERLSRLRRRGDSGATMPVTRCADGYVRACCRFSTTCKVPSGRRGRRTKLMMTVVA